VAAGIIDHIYLTCVKAGLERCEWYVQLEDGGFPFARIQLGNLDQRTLVGLGLSLKKCDVGQEADARLVCAPGRIRDRRPGWIVNLVVEKQMLRGRENMLMFGMISEPS